MEFSILFLSTALFIFISILLFLLPSKAKQKRLPPGPKGLPIIGNLLQIGKRPHVTFTNLAKTYGPLMTMQLGRVTTIVASSPEMAREILLRKDQVFLGRPMPHAATAQVDHELSMGWISGGSHWSKLRRICNTRIFTSQKLDSLKDLRHQVTRNMMDRVDKARKTGEPIYLGRVVFGTVLSTFSNIMFTIDVLDPRSKDVHELKDLIGRIMKLAAKPNLADYFPILKPFDPQGIRKGVKPSFVRLHSLIEGMIEKRLERRASGSPGSDDFLDALLDGEEISQPNVKTLLTDLLIGGNDSITATMEWTMTEILHNPPVMEKAKRELSEKFGSATFLEEQEIMQLPYLDAIIKESMRLHPIAPLLLPHLTEEDVEISGFFIPKHTQVFVNWWSISRDESYWEEPEKFRPEKFRPERFLGSEFDFRGNKMPFFPFGIGRRMCPGVSLAIRMVNLLLANLLHNFDWKLPNGVTFDEMDMTDTLGIVHQKAQPLVAIPV